MSNKAKKCCICGGPLDDEFGFGFNPKPVKQSGRCCRNCNYTIVLKARFEAVKKGNGLISTMYGKERT